MGIKHDLAYLEHQIYASGARNWNRTKFYLIFVQFQNVVVVAYAQIKEVRALRMRRIEMQTLMRAEEQGVSF
jgi:hypothetical protein